MSYFELREIFNIKLFRPLLLFHKKSNSTTKFKKKIDFISDSSNLMINILDRELEKFLITKKIKNNLIRATFL